MMKTSPSLSHNRRARLRLLAINPQFPLTFFLRNMMLLEQEKNWQKLPPRLKRLRLGTMLQERLAIFREVKKWASLHQRGPCRKTESAPDDGCDYQVEAEAIASYCVNCGMCCEFASALPDFPPESIIPTRWKSLFGEGLGRGHRFCPFLWESREPRGSRCSIHSWRANPCRIFEADDCEIVKLDPEFKTLATSRRELMHAWRRLRHSVF